MTWDRSVLGLLDDLEQQAAGLALRDRDLEIEDLSHSAYGAVTMAARWHAADGLLVRLRLRGGLVLSGRVERTGSDWVLVRDDSETEWLVPHAAVLTASGLPQRSVDEQLAGVVRRLGIAAVLRQLAWEELPCIVHLLDGERVVGRVARVGADFVDVVSASEREGRGGRPIWSVVPWVALTAVQQRR